jgi:hypothetical protein
MDLNLKALIGVTYLIPIAITLRKIYAPNFDIPEALSLALARIDKASGRHDSLESEDQLREVA